MCVVIASRALACTAALAACGDPPARVRLVPVAFATGCGRPALSPPVMRVIAYGSGPDSKRSADAPIGDFPADTEQLGVRSEEHTSELQSRLHLVCRLLLEKK